MYYGCKGIHTTLHVHTNIAVLLKMKKNSAIKNGCMPKLGVKVRNMKMDFNTGGTWRQVGQ